LHTIDSPAVLLSKINEMLIDIFGNSNFFLVSAFVGCLSEDSLIYVNAGHPAPLHIERASGNIAPLEPGGMLLGIFENAKYDIHEMKMENEDVLMIYTDGLYEKVGSQNCSNDKDITDICQHNLGLLFENKKAFLDRLLEECADEENGAFDDDVAVMLVMKK
ncbi:MAG: serine/threonine-protein phosphatase, partial [Clostridiales bacterium]|nr:serine/threonine-protein phosphatase [Clostridiales bacterium]